MALSDTQKGMYLQAMGIQAYYPRRPLPGAKPSNAYASAGLSTEAPVRKEEGVSAAAAAQKVLQILNPASSAQPARSAASAASPSNRALSKRVQAVAESLKQAEHKAAPSATHSPEPADLASSASAGAQSNRAPLRFVLAYIPVSEHLAVITELPWSKSAALSAASATLLSGILNALGISVEAQHLHPMVFTWPLFEDAGLEFDEEGARQTLEGFVAKRIRLRPVKNLLLMAEDAAPLLFPEGYLEGKGAVLQHPRLALRVILTHSLSVMEPAQDPALALQVKERKGLTWKILQPLQGSLNGTENSAQE